MKGFIKVHAVSVTDKTQVDAIILPLSHIEVIAPAESFTAINGTTGSYCVTETVDQIEELINNAV